MADGSMKLRIAPGADRAGWHAKEATKRDLEGAPCKSSAGFSTPASQLMGRPRL